MNDSKIFRAFVFVALALVAGLSISNARALHVAPAPAPHIVGASVPTPPPTGTATTVLTYPGAFPLQWSAPTGGTGGSAYAAYTSRPSPGTAGRIFTPSLGTGSVQFVDDGSAWHPLILGCVGTEVAPGNSISGLTQVGTAPSTVNVTGGVLAFHHVVNGGNTLGGYEKAKTSGQTLTVHLIPQIFPTGSNSDIELAPVGVWVRDSVSGKVEGIFYGDTGLQNGLPTINVYTYTNLTTFAGNPSGGSVMTLAHGIWLRIVDTTTTLVFEFSYNGQYWDTAYTDGATYLGNQGNEYGVGADPVHQAITTIVDSLGVQ